MHKRQTWFRVATTTVLLLAGTCAPQLGTDGRNGTAGRSGMQGAGTGGKGGASPGTGGVGGIPAGGPGGGNATAGSGGSSLLEDDPPFWASKEVLAKRLARLIWDADPDDSVRQGLDGPPTRDAVGRLAERMLDDTRARSGVDAFYRWWLYFERERREVADPIEAALRREAPALGTYLTLDVNGSFEDLLTAPYTFLNELSASVYGLSGVSGSEMRRVPYPAGEPRIGLLTGAGLLSFYNSTVDPSWPAKRGWMVTEPLLCTPVIRSFLPVMELDTSRSIRQQMIDVTAMETCGLCHKILNSPGFAYIGFDSQGRWRPQAGAAPNETEGWIPAEIMPDMPRFNGPAELARLLASREEAKRCFVRQWMLFSRDRSGAITPSPRSEDAPSEEVVTRSFAASGFRLRSLVVAVVRSNVFVRP